MHDHSSVPAGTDQSRSAAALHVVATRSLSSMRSSTVNDFSAGSISKSCQLNVGSVAVRRVWVTNFRSCGRLIARGSSQPVLGAGLRPALLHDSLTRPCTAPEHLVGGGTCRPREASSSNCREPSISVKSEEPSSSPYRVSCVIDAAGRAAARRPISSSASVTRLSTPGRRCP